MKRFILFISIFSGTFISLSGQIANNTWRDHFSYTTAVSVASSGEKIYCAAYGGISILDLTDNSIRKLSKANGLSDVNISKIKFAPDAKTLIVTYQNGNIDIIEENTITNITDIKRKNTLGDKTINSIELINGFAYLSTGFGIVVLDYNKKEIKDTYFFGPGGTNINVSDVTSDGENIYAATKEGIYKAEINNPLLIDYNNWTLISDESHYSHIEYVNNKLFAVLFNRPEGSPHDDNLFVLENNTWSLSDFDQEGPINDINSFGDYLYVIYYGRVARFNTNTKANNDFWSGIPSEIYLENENDFWIADNTLGLVHFTENGKFEYTESMPNGPKFNQSFSLEIMDNNVYLTRGSITSNYGNTYTTGDFSVFQNESWTSYTNNDVRDVIRVAIDPKNSDRVMIGTWGYGMYEYNEGILTENYNAENQENHTLEPETSGASNIRIGGLCFDDDGNLWISNSGVNNPISVLKSDGTWKQMDYGDEAASSVHGQIINTSYDQKWILLRNGSGIFVLDTGEDIDDESDDLTKRVNIIDDEGENLNTVFSIAEDLNGDIWIGTNKGPVVYYSAQRILDENLVANRIFVPRNNPEGHAGKLLETETISAIAIDGANRKWLGTLNSGIFLMSEDGTKELAHFEESNSPLISNQINDIKIHPKTGEIFIATNKGLVSYMGQATEGNEYFRDVYVYPNPIRPDYTGDITISGLVEDVNVKITDVSGNLVYETTSLGGQAIWDGNNFDGERVHTGVYLVFCTNDDGSKTHVTKLLFIH